MWEDQQLFISAVYASTNYLTRRNLWSELENLKANNHGPWCYIGDFNVVLGAHEVKGSHLPRKTPCDDFKAWTETYNLLHLPTRGAEFTWSNGRKLAAHTQKRLDRSICDDNWISYWNSSSCYTLTKCHSDHHPLLLIMKKGAKSHPSPFKFLSMWPDHPDCSRLVSEIWAKPVAGCPMYILSQKLKSLNNELKVWNKTVFGDINLRVEHALAEVDMIHEQISSGGLTDDLKVQEEKAQMDLQQAISYEEQI